MNKGFYNPNAEKVHEVPDDQVPATRLKALVLDDDDDLNAVLKEYLRSNGYDVTSVTNGVEGVKHIMATDFDVIVCDMLMPALPGDMFYRAVERTKPHLCKRFIFMTGHMGDQRIDQFIRSVKGLMLWKPFEMHSLAQAIQTIQKKNAAAGS